jgi:ABC-2 type transport system permease protein
MREYHPLRELFLARARQFFREPETIFWVYFFPLIMMLTLGMAFRSPPESIVRIRIEGKDRDRCERLSALLSGAGIEIEAESKDGEPKSEASREARTELDPTIDLIVVCGENGDYELRVDPARPSSVLARERVERRIRASTADASAPNFQESVVDAPGARYIDWLVPGLIGLNILGGGIYGVGFVAVDLRIRKLLKRLRATPMRRTHFLVSLIGGRLVFLIPEMSAILLVAHYLFGVEIRGHLLAVFGAGFIGAVSFAGIGLLVASRATKIETISGLMNLILMPMWLFGDVFFAAARYPDWMQPFVLALPLTQLNRAFRGIILEGHTIADESTALAIVLAWGLIAFPIALKWFRWQ